MIRPKAKKHTPSMPSEGSETLLCDRRSARAPGASGSFGTRSAKGKDAAPTMTICQRTSRPTQAKPTPTSEPIMEPMLQKP